MAESYTDYHNSLTYSPGQSVVHNPTLVPTFIPTTSDTPTYVTDTNNVPQSYFNYMVAASTPPLYTQPNYSAPQYSMPSPYDSDAQWYDTQTSGVLSNAYYFSEDPESERKCNCNLL